MLNKIIFFIFKSNLNLFHSDENPCEYAVDIALSCINENSFEIIPSRLQGDQLLWFYDIETHSCKYIDHECVNSDNINRFQSFDTCKSQCIPNVTQMQTQGKQWNEDFSFAYCRALKLIKGYRIFWAFSTRS